MGDDPTVTRTRTAAVWTARCSLVGAVVTTLVVGVPGAASAHAVPGAPVTVADFVRSGFIHMLTGWDHLLFVTGVVLVAGDIRRSATMISAFAAGHSTTLILAAAGGWLIDPALIDIVIALSVVFVGLAGWVGWPGGWRAFAGIVFGFGLAHGIGLATRLQNVGLPNEGLLPRVIAFNVGVEIGQLLAVVAVYLLGNVVRRHVTWPAATRYANIGLVTAGTVGAVTLAVVAATTPAP